MEGWGEGEILFVFLCAGLGCLEAGACLNSVTNGNRMHESRTHLLFFFGCNICLLSYRGCPSVVRMPCMLLHTVDLAKWFPPPRVFISWSFVSPHPWLEGCNRLNVRLLMAINHMNQSVNQSTNQINHINQLASNNRRIKSNQIAQINQQSMKSTNQPIA